MTAMTTRIVDRIASFATQSPADIWATNGGIYLGLTPQGGTDQRRPLAGKELDPSVPRGAQFRTTWEPDGGLHLYIGEGHLGTWGPQGVGKTRKLFMPNLFKLRDWSCVVIDTKGQLCAYTALARAAGDGHRVYVIDPFKVIETNYPRLFAENPALFKSHGYNPVAALNPQSPSFIDDAKAMAMAVIQSENARDPYWPMAAQAMAKGLLMVLRLDRPGMSDSLGVLRDYLGLRPGDIRDKDDKLIEAGMATLLAEDVKKHSKVWPAIAACLNEFTRYNPEDRELSGIRRTAIAQTDWLDSPLIRADLAQNNAIDFGSLKDTPTTIYLILPPEQLATHGVWLRLMVTAAMRPLLRSVERSPVPVLFMLDEFPQLGRMAMIESNIAQMRQFGIKLWTVWQHVEQMKKIYPDSWADFMATAEAKITFTANDVETREYFSKLSGERLFTHKTRSEAVNRSQGGSWGSSYSTGTSVNDGTSSGSSWGSSHTSTNGSFSPGTNSGSNTGLSQSKGGSSNAGSSQGGSWGISQSETTSEQHINERCVRPHELAALDADEALLFARRGRMHRAICPQPEILPGVREAIEAARLSITGKRQLLT